MSETTKTIYQSPILTLSCSGQCLEDEGGTSWLCKKRTEEITGFLIEEGQKFQLTISKFPFDKGERKYRFSVWAGDDIELIFKGEYISLHDSFTELLENITGSYDRDGENDFGESYWDIYCLLSRTD